LVLCWNGEKAPSHKKIFNIFCFSKIPAEKCCRSFFLKP